MDNLCFQASPCLWGMPLQANISSRHTCMLSLPMKTMQPRGSRGAEGKLPSLDKEKDKREERETPSSSRHRRGGNWVLKILRVGSNSALEDRKRRGRDDAGEKYTQISVEVESCSSCCATDFSESGGCRAGDGEDQTKVDAVSFRRMLRRVSLPEAKLYGRLSHLGRLAYDIPRTKSEDLLKYHRLSFVTSSLENNPEIPPPQPVNSAAKDHEMKTLEEVLQEEEAEEEEEEAEEEEEEEEEEDEKEESEKAERSRLLLTPSSVYRVAAAAAYFLKTQTKSILPFKRERSEMDLSNEEEDEEEESRSPSAASFVATTSSVTAVVAAKEETKLAIAKDLNSSASAPCEWFICDDDATSTRFFIIQGSDSLASWQANLLFEPTRFEGLDVLVHRGIYEAAKGIYKQLLAEVRSHLKSRGASATLRFTGHSLGGSLSLLVSLMLIVREEVPRASLLPVVMFGSPYVMCGGDYLLRKLGLPLNHVQSVAMHRDIVPRAFSCSYPDYLAEILKAINSKFRDHPCLENKFLYSPMGELLILQPEETYSPQHHLLPPGSGLYFFGGTAHETHRTLLHAAKVTFLNSPHPLEILSDRAAYGFRGTIYRDHDVHAYVRSILTVVRRELESAKKTGGKRRSHRRGRRRRSGTWWPPVGLRTIDGSAVSGPLLITVSVVVEGGRASLSKLRELVSFGKVNVVLVFLLPVGIQQFTWIHILQ